MTAAELAAATGSCLHVPNWDTLNCTLCGRSEMELWASYEPVFMAQQAERRRREAARLHGVETARRRAIRRRIAAAWATCPWCGDVVLPVRLWPSHVLECPMWLEAP